MNKDNDQTNNTFIWQNNLIKFYLTHDLDKAIDYSTEILDEQGQILSKDNLYELKFNLATAYNLRGDEQELSEVITLYKECLEFNKVTNVPFIHNNLGMAHFFNFAWMSKEIGDPQKATLEALKPVAE
jgi:hypothetical protein